MKRLKKLDLSTVCIVVGICGLLYIYGPVLWAAFSVRFLPNPVVNAQVTDDFAVTIPKLHIHESIQANVDPFNSVEYLRVLKTKVAHAKGTALPGSGGSVYLFAHSSASPWELTHTNTPFLLLSELKQGDTIYVDYGKVRHVYAVDRLLTVKPWQVEALLNSTGDQLILQTCTPIGTALNRLLVFATPV